jgi:5-methylcytosine-specific restriction endonuclease McrA
VSSAKSRRAHLYRSLVLQLHGHAPCWICGLHMEPHDATLEHLKPHAQGGTLRYDNVVLTHSRCNNLRHNAGPSSPTSDDPGECVAVDVAGDAASPLAAARRRDS